MACLIISLLILYIAGGMRTTTMQGQALRAAGTTNPSRSDTTTKAKVLLEPVEPLPKLSSEERFEKGKEFTFTISANNISKSENFGNVFDIPNSEWHLDMQAIDQALKDKGQGCLVYSFGIAQDDPYTNFMAMKGCQVYAFDPTVRHPYKWKDNVLFHPWGIRNSAKPSNWTHSKYGNVTGSLFSLPEIVKKLGHDDGRAITALKFDCEGCEYGAFKDIVEYEQETGKSFNPIFSLNTEFHMSTTLGMTDVEDIATVHYAKLFLESQKCETVYFRINKGFRWDRTILKELKKLPQHVCCYEYGFSCSVSALKQIESN